MKGQNIAQQSAPDTNMLTYKPSQATEVLLISKDLFMEVPIFATATEHKYVDLQTLTGNGGSTHIKGSFYGSAFFFGTKPPFFLEL